MSNSQGVSPPSYCVVPSASDGDSNIMMRSALACILSIAAVQVSSRAVGSDSPSCKAVPGSTDWPSPEIWGTLNETTGGRLLQPTPPGAVCHKTQPSYNAAKCIDVQNNWPNELFHTNDPISVEWNNWTNDTCIPVPSLDCSSVGYPVYVINATTPQHVKAGVDFGAPSLSGYLCRDRRKEKLLTRSHS